MNPKPFSQSLPLIRDGATDAEIGRKLREVIAARGLRILYIAEQSSRARGLGTIVGSAVGKSEKTPARRSSFPIRRFSARALA